MGQSEAFLELQERISQAAQTERPVILIGERGTGKELAALRLHMLSGRWGEPYVTLNCASLSPTLIESELFGHEAGSFTGATRLRRGRFELASGGSLFLDEVGNIPMTVQEKILRVVEYGQMERVGAMGSMQTDVRLIAATNVDLRRHAEEGRFRRDLLDRLAFEVIVLPPLRERRGDIALLAHHFAGRMAVELGRSEPPVFSDAAMQALLDYHWPGNIRELKNVVERMVYRQQDVTIEQIVFDPFDSPWIPTSDPAAAREKNEREFPDETKTSNAADKQTEEARLLDSKLPLHEAVRKLELIRIKEALEANRHNQRHAAESLGLTYHQFRGYYRKYRDVINSQ